MTQLKSVTLFGFLAGLFWTVCVFAAINAAWFEMGFCFGMAAIFGWALIQTA